MTQVNCKWTFALFGCDFEQILRQVISIRVKTLSNTNLIASRLIEREKCSLPVDVRGSKTSMLKLTIIIISGRQLSKITLTINDQK